MVGDRLTSRIVDGPPPHTPRRHPAMLQEATRPRPGMNPSLPCAEAQPTVTGTASATDGIATVDPRSCPDWDNLVASHPEATVFHTSAWARALLDTYGFTPRYLLQHRASVPVAGLPLMQTGGRWTGRHAVSLPFTDNCPPLRPNPTPPTPTAGKPGPASPDPDAPPANSLRVAAPGEPLLTKALDWTEAAGCRSLEIRDAPAWTQRLTSSVAFHGHLVPLFASVEDQLGRCSPSMRRALRKAERSPLRLKEGRDLADVEAYYELHCETRQRHGLPPQPLAFFRNIHRHLLHHDLGFVILALAQDRPVAGALFLTHRRHALYKFGASSESHLELRPNNLVLWQGIRRCAELGFPTLDLGRTSLDNEGLRRFKLGLGGEERLITYVRQDVRSGCISVTPDRAQGWHTRVFRLLPRPISRLLGMMLYRFVA